MNPQRFRELLADKDACLVYLALETAFVGGVELRPDRAEVAIDALFESNLAVAQLPLAMKLCHHSVEWLEYAALNDPMGLVERVLEVEKGVKLG